MKIEYRGSDAQIIEHARVVEQQLGEVGRDTKTIKCILTAPSMKAKAKCGLEP